MDFLTDNSRKTFSLHPVGCSGWMRVATGFAVGLGIGLLFYIALRAFVLSFTHDEAYTAVRYVPQTVWEVVTYRYPDVNNHILNTLLMKASAGCFGMGEWALRAPNVLAGGIYLVALWFLLKRVVTRWVGVVGFIMLAANPYVLDFFSVARGYGLSLALMTVSLLAMRVWLETGCLRMLAFIFSAAILGAWANMSLLVWIVGLFAAVGVAVGVPWLREIAVRPVSRRPPFPWPELAITVFSGMALAAMLGLPIVRASAVNGFYVGGKSGFLNDTVRSLVYDSWYRCDYGALTSWWVWGAFSVVLAGALLCALALVDACRRLSWVAIRSPAAQAPFLLFTTMAVSMAQCELTGSNTLRDRTAVFFIPLFGWAAIEACDWFVQRGRVVRVMLAMGLCLLCLLATVHLVRSLNLRHTSEYRFDCATRDALKRLGTDIHQDGRSGVSLGINKGSLLTAAYYLSRGYLPLVGRLVGLNEGECFENTTFDYYVLVDGVDRLPSDAGKIQWIHSYPEANLNVVKRRIGAHESF